MEVSIKIKDSEVLFSGPLCVVRGVLSVKSGGKVSSGSVLQSDWLSAGAEGEAFRLEVSSARSMQGYTRTGVSDGSILSYGKEDLFFRDADKNHVPDIKLGYQLNTATGKFRVALKFKSSFGGGELLYGFVLLSWDKSREAEPVLTQEIASVLTEEATTPESEDIETADLLIDQTSEPEDILPDMVIFTPEIEEQSPKEEPEPTEVSALEALSKAVEGLSDMEDLPVSEQEPFFIANPPHFLHPGWKYTLRTNIAAREEEILWEATEGTVDRFGVYTAPDRPGMYEVMATRTSTGQTAQVFMIIVN